jgi:hypothetical protein
MTAFNCPHSGCGRLFSIYLNMHRHLRTHGGALNDGLGGGGAPGTGGTRSGNAYPPELDEDMEEGTPESEEWSSDEW